jgi:uncharacterized SAM-binding protein YcdF (DUF218 family)
MTKRGKKISAAAAIGTAALAIAIASGPQPENAPAAIHADAALIPSGDVDYVRVKHASDLYRAEAVKALLLTGQGVGGDSAVEMRRQAIAAGVPAEAIVLETASTTTRENLVFAAPLVKERGWRRIALVTSQSHLARALAAARKAMPDVDWVPAPVPDAGPPDRARRLRAEETLKHLWYLVRGWA